MKVVVDFADGSTLTIGSDRMWKSNPAEWIVEGKPSYRNGEGIPAEYIDGRRYPIGWNLPGFDDRDWTHSVELGPQPTDPWIGPLIAQETTIDEYEIEPREVRRLGEDHYIADLGKVYSGRPKIYFSGGEPGTWCVLRPIITYSRTES